MGRYEIVRNGKLAKPFHPYRDDNKLITAAYWAPWWLEREGEEPDWKNRIPVFSQASLEKITQQLSSPFATHTAGLWQQIPSVAGNEYEFTAEGQAWSSEDNEPGSQLESSDVNLQIGIDPTGGLDPGSPLIIWSELWQPLSRWETLRVTAKAEAGIITLYLKSAPSLPKRQQTVFWREARLRPIGRHKRGVNIVGAGDTHIALEPEQPEPGEPVTAVISSNRPHPTGYLQINDPDHENCPVQLDGKSMDGDRHVWRYQFTMDQDGLYDIRFLGDHGARLLALRLLRVARDVQLVPASGARYDYQKVYVLLPPTADKHWFLAAARGGFDGRFTIGFSADDAGIGDFSVRHVLAINPHHWPEVLTAAWFQQHYPGTRFTPVVAGKPEDLEAFLRNWTGING
jgi:hypothetical protein